MIPGIQVNKKTMGVLVVTSIIVGYMWYSHQYNDGQKRIQDKESGKQGNLVGVGESLNDEKNQEELKVQDEEDQDEETIGSGVEYKDDFFDFNGFHVRMISCKSTIKDTQYSKLTVLLLHGMAFSSENWKQKGILQFLARNGYHPVAIDLPNNKNGQSKGPENFDKLEFMNNLIKQLELNNFVMVSPSYSGGFSIPYIIEHHSDTSLKGYIPVAPVIEPQYKDSLKTLTDLPTLILHGDKDYMGIEVSKTLSDIPNSKVIPINNAGHPAYIDNTEMFNSVVKEFLDSLK